MLSILWAEGLMVKDRLASRGGCSPSLLGGTFSMSRFSEAGPRLTPKFMKMGADVAGRGEKSGLRSQFSHQPVV